MLIVFERSTKLLQLNFQKLIINAVAAEDATVLV